MSVVGMSRLGSMGRFGNQVFQAAFLHVYARRHGAAVETPPWVGNQIFGLVDPPISQARAPYNEPTDAAGYPIPPAGEEALDRDFVGWGQLHASWYAPDRQFIRSLFTPRLAIEERLRAPLERLRGRGETRVGLHIRRGDYGRSIFYITPIEWYRRLLAELWPTLHRPALFIATEDPSLVKAFEEYAPVLVEDLGLDLRAEPLTGYNYLRPDLVTMDPRQLDFYPDFYLLSKCEIVIAPNSTFSFAAAMLNPELRAFYRSSLHLQGFERRDPWDAWPLQHDRVEDFPLVDGIACETNGYWG